jgi:hypothetical protein
LKPSHYDIRVESLRLTITNSWVVYLVIMLNFIADVQWQTWSSMTTVARGCMPGLLIASLKSKGTFSGLELCSSQSTEATTSVPDRLRTRVSSPESSIASRNWGHCHLLREEETTHQIICSYTEKGKEAMTDSQH